MVFLTIHIVTALADPFTHLGWVPALIPFGSSYRTFWLGLGTIGAELMFAVVVTSLLRRLIGQAAWRAVHWLAYACWPIAVVHGLGTGTNSRSAWLIAVDAACLLAVAIALATRLWTPAPDPLGVARAGFRQRVHRRRVGSSPRSLPSPAEGGGKR